MAAEPATEMPAELPTNGGAPARTRELRARGQRTLRRLLDAGVEVFEAHGYHAARVDDIVKLAKTSHGTFYLYFANKEDLFSALMHEVSDQMQALAEDLGPLRPGEKGRAELQAWIARFAGLYEQYGPIIRAWTEAEIGSQAFGRVGTDVLTRFTRVLTERIAAAAPKDIDPVVAALAIVAMLERLNYYVVSRQVRVSRAQMVETLAVSCTLPYSGTSPCQPTFALTPTGTSRACPVSACPIVLGHRAPAQARPEPSFRREAAANVPGQITSSRNSRGPVSQGDRPRPELMAIHELELDALAADRRATSARVRQGPAAQGTRTRRSVPDLPTPGGASRHPRTGPRLAPA